MLNISCTSSNLYIVFGEMSFLDTWANFSVGLSFYYWVVSVLHLPWLSSLCFVYWNFRQSNKNIGPWKQLSLRAPCSCMGLVPRMHAHCNRCDVIPHCDFNLHFSLTVVQHMLFYLLASVYVSSWEMTISGSLPFFHQVIFLYWVTYMSIIVALV